MKKIVIVRSRPAFYLLLLLMLSVNANAQYSDKKLPEVQPISLRAPDNIKIDGKTTEWDDKLQARNTIDRIVYTICNDDKNLYFTARAGGAYPGAKIVSGGLTLTISHSVEKKKRDKDPGNVSVTFQTADLVKAASINAKHYHYWNNLAGNVMKHKGEIDSLHMAIDAQVSEAFKEIVVTGVKDMDTLSVYNTEGIKAVIHFNDTFTCIFEMAIPLKYLGLSTDNPEKFSYNIKIGAQRLPQRRVAAGQAVAARVQSMGGVQVMDIRGGGISMDAPIMPIMMGPPDRDMVYLGDDTDFWAEYTLAKKII